MTQLKITLDESQVALVTQLLEALHVSYERLETGETTEQGYHWLDQLPTSSKGPNLDNVNIRQYAYEE